MNRENKAIHDMSLGIFKYEVGILWKLAIKKKCKYVNYSNVLNILETYMLEKLCYGVQVNFTHNHSKLLACPCTEHAETT